MRQFWNVAAAARHAIATLRRRAPGAMVVPVDRAVVAAATLMLKSGGEAANKISHSRKRSGPIHFRPGVFSPVVNGNDSHTLTASFEHEAQIVSQILVASADLAGRDFHWFDGRAFRRADFAFHCPIFTLA